jgi:hypothetical protein
VLVPNQIIVTAITADEYIGTATALSLSIRTIGQVIGYSLFFNRLMHTVSSKAFDIMLPVAIQTGVLDAELITTIVSAVTSTPWSQYYQEVPQIDSQEKIDLFGEALIILWSQSLPIVYYISIPFGVTACITCLFIGDLRPYMNQHVARHL